jgi:hypothetical protein
MISLFTLGKWLPVLTACVMASVSYPPIPADLTTPVQQRIAISGPNGEFNKMHLKVPPTFPPP